MLFLGFHRACRSAQLVQKIPSVTPDCTWKSQLSLSLSLSRSTSSSATCGKMKRVVYISRSKDIFENLALEDWLYHHGDLTTTDFLLLWRNRSALVIGQHQNPWLECNVLQANRQGVPVARRASGGGTVYHDEGNLNLSFLKHRGRYNRRENLSLVVSALTSRWDLDLAINCRDDLVLDGVYKVSGTASKLGGPRTYHHFTLVHDLNRDIMTSLLASPMLGVQSRATHSIPSPVKNLKEDAPNMTHDLLVEVIGQHFTGEHSDKDVTAVDPCDEHQFPGVSSIVHRLRSWDWVYGRTPPFTLTRTFTKCFPSDTHPAYPRYTLRTQGALKKGCVENVTLDLSGQPTDGDSSVTLPLTLPFDLPRDLGLQGCRLEEGVLADLWARGRAKVKAVEDDHQRELLAWTLQCLACCLPAGGRRENS